MSENDITRDLIEVFVAMHKNYFFKYLHLPYQAGFTKVNILVRVKCLQRFHQCWYINVVIIIKMAKPPGRNTEKSLQP